jgi:hypothetical protein
MKNKAYLVLAKKLVLVLLVGLTLLYGLTGYGITEFRTVGALTFGLLGKNLAFNLHNALTIPYVVAIVLHVWVNLALRRAARKP